MDEKARTNPFSISNILGSHSSRDNEEREVTTTSENERDKDITEAVDDKGTVGGRGSFIIGRKTPTHGDLYDWETESTEHDSAEKSLTELDGKWDYFFLHFALVKLTVVVVRTYVCSSYH